MKFKRRFIIAALCALVLFLLYWYSDENLSWEKIIELHAVDVYQPTGTDKFGNELLYTVDNKDTLTELELIFNSVEHSSDIKQITIDDEVFDANYFAMLDIRPIYTANINGKEEASYRLLHLFIKNKIGYSYLIVVGTGRGYVFDSKYTDIFVNLLVEK